MLYRLSRQLWLAWTLALIGAACSCSPKGSQGQPMSPAAGARGPDAQAQSGNAKLTGTVLDAATGMPVGGVTVEAFGKTCKSGADGRFLLSQLPEGRRGTLRAKASDGRRAENSLQPLRAGGLEVVLHLKVP